MQLRDLKLKLIGIEAEISDAEKDNDQMRQLVNPNNFRTTQELKTERSALQNQIKFLESEKATLEKKRKVTKDKPKNALVKEEFEKTQKANPKLTADEVLYKVADKLGDTYESIKGSYYYKPKKPSK